MLVIRRAARSHQVRGRVAFGERCGRHKRARHAPRSGGFATLRFGFGAERGGVVGGPWEGGARASRACGADLSWSVAWRRSLGGGEGWIWNLERFGSVLSVEPHRTAPVGGAKCVV